MAHAFKALVKAFKEWTFRKREKQLELGVDKAMKEKNTEDLQKSIGDLLK